MRSLEQIEAFLKECGTLEVKEAKELVQENAINGKLFRKAASDGHLNVVKFFFEAEDHFKLTSKEAFMCTNRRAVSPGGLTPLHFASYHGFIDIVKVLISKEDLREIQRRGRVTPLYCASRQGHLDLVKLFVSCNEPTSKQHIDAMNIAAYMGHIEIVKYLFSVGIPGDEAMRHATGRGWKDIVRFLLNNGVHPDGLTDRKLLLIRTGSSSLSVMEKVFFEKDFLLTSFEKQDESQLIADSRPGLYYDAWNIYDDPPIHLATERGHVSIVKLFLQANASVNVENRASYTPLDSAIAKGHTSIALLLKSYGGVLNKSGEFLKQAIENGRFLAVLGLHAMGADLNCFGKLDYSRCSRLQGQDSTPLHIAALNNHINIVQYLLQCNVLVDARDNRAVTSLHYACAGGYSEVVKLLVERGASVNTKNRLGECPLSLSLMRGSTDLVRYLLENDACPNMRCYEDESGLLHGYHFCNEELPSNDLYDEDENHDMGVTYGWTPLHRATLMNNTSAAKLLIDFGAEVNALNQDGRTALHNVLSVEMTELLLKNNADPLILENEGLTPLHCAKMNQRKEIVLVLEKHAKELNYRNRLNVRSNDYCKLVDILYPVQSFLLPR